MRTLLTVIASLVFLTSIAQETGSPAPSYPVMKLKNIFPADFNDFLIDLPLTTLQAKRPKVVYDTTENEKAAGNVVYYLERLSNNAQFKEISYYTHDSKEVYEYLFQYNDNITQKEVEQMALKKYGTPNFADADFPYQWIIKVDDELTVQVWVYLNRLIIANKKYAY